MAYVFYFDNRVCLYTVQTNCFCGHSLKCQRLWDKRLSSFSLSFLYHGSLHFISTFHYIYVSLVAKRRNAVMLVGIFWYRFGLIQSIVGILYMCSLSNYGNNSSDSGMTVVRCYAGTNILQFAHMLSGFLSHGVLRNK
jgi:hypothetical protein